jgi:N-acetylgalactosamine-6-sulfatase
MKRRTLLQSLGGLGLSLAGGVHGARSAPPPSSRLNVLFILADDMGYGDLSSYGNTTTNTPHIDGIGKQGVTFTNFYCNSAECTPTRSALMSGEYQQRFGGLECAIGLAMSAVTMKPSGFRNAANWAFHPRLLPCPGS